MRNNTWYVLLVVPLQTALSLFLAVLVNGAILRGRGFFRTAFYFPSVTARWRSRCCSLFLFSTTGVVNEVLGAIGINGPNWFADPRGLLHILFGAVGITDGPAALTENDFLGLSWWNWLAGPSVAMTVFIIMAIFTTSGTFMLLFLAALQNISPEVQEAAMVDGANAWQRFWRVTLPQLKPALFTVLTLGLIGCWQVFDQIYTGTKGQPGQDDADARVPLVRRSVPRPGLGAGRGDRVHPLRDHRRASRSSSGGRCATDPSPSAVLGSTSCPPDPRRQPRDRGVEAGAEPSGPCSTPAADRGEGKETRP